MEDIQNDKCMHGFSEFKLVIKWFYNILIINDLSTVRGLLRSSYIGGRWYKEL